MAIKRQKVNVLIAVAILIIPIALVIFLWANSPECPDSCNDDNNCTKDYCGEHTEFECVHDVIVGCEGNLSGNGSKT